MSAVTPQKNKKTRVYIPVEINGQELSEMEKVTPFPIDGKKICEALRFFSDHLAKKNEELQQASLLKKNKK